MPKFFKDTINGVLQNADGRPAGSIESLITSGQYRDIPRGVIDRYMNRQASEEDTIAAITGTPVFDPSKGPIVATNPEQQKQQASYENSRTASGQGYTSPGVSDALAPKPAQTPDANTTPPPEVGAAGTVPPGPQGTMSPQSYTVQPGDTLSKIGSQFGVSPSDITGYRSGNPNLIFPGEKLSVGRSKPLLTGGSGGAPGATGASPGGVPPQGGGGGGTPPPSPVPPAVNTDAAMAGKDPMSLVKDFLNKAGLQASSSFQDDTNAYADYYSQFYTKNGLTDIKTQYTDTMKQFTDLQNKKNEDISKINENPWLTENERLARVQKLNDKYDLKLNTMSSNMDLFKSMYDSGRQDAQFMATQAMTAYHNKQTMQQDVIFKAIDTAEKYAEATNAPFNLNPGAVRYQRNPQTGQYEPIASGQGKYTRVGTDADGNPVYGYVDQGAAGGATPSKGGGGSSSSGSTPSVNKKSSGYGVVGGQKVDPTIAGDLEAVLTGRNTLYNIRQTMGRTKQAATYMKKMRDALTAIDPNFDFVASDAGGKFVSSEFYQRSMSAINTVEPNIQKVIDLSNQVSRIGVAGVDSILQKGSVQIGNKKVANFREAQKLIADEIGLALGQGTVSDMKLQLGFDITDPSMSQEVFASNMGLVKEFIDNRKAGLNDQRYKSGTTQGGGGTQTSSKQITYQGKTYNVDANGDMTPVQ